MPSPAETKTQTTEPLTIAFTYTPKIPYLQRGLTETQTADLADDGTISAISNALQKLGHNVIHVAGIESLVAHFAAGDQKEWDLVFNYAEGIRGSATSREAQVPALLEAYGVDFTFGDSACLSACGGKGGAKMILSHHGIPTAPFIVIPKYGSAVDYESLLQKRAKQLSYPLFAKPVAASTSNGITPANKIRRPENLKDTVETLRGEFKDQEILLEEFLPGTEYTVAILGPNQSPRVLGVSVVTWYNPEGADSKSKANSGGQDGGEDGKEEDGAGDEDGVNFATCYSKFARGPGQDIGTETVSLSDPVVNSVADVAVETYKVLGCRDAARVDVRLSRDGVPNVIEVNPIFGLRDDVSLFTRIARDNGMEYHELLGEIIACARARGKEVV